MRDKLLGGLVSTHQCVLDKVNESVGVTLVLEEEINTIVHLLNVDAFLGSTAFQDELFQEHESSLVIDLLSDLDSGSPDMRSESPLTVFALEVDHLEFDLKSLLERSVLSNLLLHSKLNSESSGVGVCPNPFSIDNLHLLKSLDLLQEKGKEIGRFVRVTNPGRSIKPLTASTMVDNSRFHNSFRNVDSGLETVDARV